MKIKLWKWHSVESQTYGWSIDEVYNDWDHIYSDPYWVDVPSDLKKGMANNGAICFFKTNQKKAFSVISTTNNKYCKPMLCGGDEATIIRLKVIAPASYEN